MLNIPFNFTTIAIVIIVLIIIAIMFALVLEARRRPKPIKKEPIEYMPNFWNYFFDNRIKNVLHDAVRKANKDTLSSTVFSSIKNIQKLHITIEEMPDSDIFKDEAELYEPNDFVHFTSIPMSVVINDVPRIEHYRFMFIRKEYGKRIRVVCNEKGMRNFHAYITNPIGRKRGVSKTK